MKRERIATALAIPVAAILAGVAIAQQQPTPHIMMTPDKIQWKAGPPSLPAGAQLAVIKGDPAQPGPFIMRLKLPANYQIGGHWHPADENVTVLSGTAHIGLGEKLDRTKGSALPAGSVMVMPSGTRHFAWTDGETILQLNGTGPWGINYVNPADDPRKP